MNIIDLTGDDSDDSGSVCGCGDCDVDVGSDSGSDSGSDIGLDSESDIDESDIDESDIDEPIEPIEPVVVPICARAILLRHPGGRGLGGFGLGKSEHSRPKYHCTSEARCNDCASIESRVAYRE